MVLVDAPRVESGESDEDFHTMKLISYLCELSSDKQTGWQSRPVALVFTKADQCEHCFDDPTAFARRHTPGLWSSNAANGSSGTSSSPSASPGPVGFRNEPHGRVHVPLRVEPRGIVEPFSGCSINWGVSRSGFVRQQSRG